MNNNNNDIGVYTPGHTHPVGHRRRYVFDTSVCLCVRACLAQALQWRI